MVGLPNVLGMYTLYGLAPKMDVTKPKGLIRLDTLGSEEVVVPLAGGLGGSRYGVMLESPHSPGRSMVPSSLTKAIFAPRLAIWGLWGSAEMSAAKTKATDTLMICIVRMLSGDGKGRREGKGWMDGQIGAHHARSASLIYYGICLFR